RRIRPWKRADETRIAEQKFLPADTDRALRIAELAVRHAHVQRVAIRHSLTATRLVERASILRLHDELDGLRRRDHHVEAKAIDQVTVGRIRIEAAVGEPFKPPA